MALISCPDCGAQVSDAAAACPRCARPIAQGYAAYPPPPVHQQPTFAPANDTVFFNQGGAMVSRSRIIIFGATYSMANITSVRTMNEDRPLSFLLWGAIFAMVGLFALATGGIGFGTFTLLAGAVFIAVWWWVKKPKYWILIGTAGAEQRAAFSHDEAWASSVAAAINQAIIARG